MSERDTYSPGVPCWVDTLQPDLETALSALADPHGAVFSASQLLYR